MKNRDILVKEVSWTYVIIHNKIEFWTCSTVYSTFGSSENLRPKEVVEDLEHQMKMGDESNSRLNHLIRYEIMHKLVQAFILVLNLYSNDMKWKMGNENNSKLNHLIRHEIMHKVVQAFILVLNLYSNDMKWKMGD